MKKIIAKLAVGPMSSECIRAAYQLSSYENIQIMLISSKSQIDYNGGYVNNWTTQQYSTYLDQLRKDYTQSDVVICRDHCGPGFNGDYDLTDTYKTVDADLQANFDFIHVDFCHYKGSHEEKLDQSARLIKYIKQPVHLEVGTDENVGAAEMNLARIEQDIDFFLSFCKPE
jgi:tagatose-1,6-bisphosphate aldolase non-catalytic subunit AgaZ/GatZ